MCTLLTSSAAAQILRLGSPRPPALDEDTYAASIVREMQSEITSLLEESDDPTSTRAVSRRARLNIRLIAAELLKRGDQLGSEGSVAIVTGLALANGRGELDAALERLLALDRAGTTNSPTLDRFRAAFGALTRFNRAAENILPDIAGLSINALDTQLPVALAALRYAIAMIEDAEPVSHWIVEADADSALPLALEELAAQLDAVLTDEAARDAIRESIAYLERGRRLPDFQPLVEQYRRELERLLRAGEAIRAADWISDERRTSLVDSLHASAIGFREIETRQDAIATIARLAAIRQLLAPLSEFQMPGPNRLDPRGARTLLDVGLTMLGEDGAGVSGELWPRLMAVIDHMRAFRDASTASISRELRGEMRNVANRLQAAYVEAETALIEQLGSMTLGAGSIGDPAFLSLLANHERALDDLLRLRRLPMWLARVESINSQAATAIEGHLRRFAEDVLSPARRQIAINALGAFEEQARLFTVLPFENELREDTEVARALTNGRAVELLRRAQELRGQWTTMWARGEQTGSVVSELTLVRRLLRTMSDVASLRAIGEDGPRELNPWSGWEITLDVLGSATNDLTNRLRFATEAVLTNNRDELVRQLDRLDEELPLPALVGRVDSLVGDRVRALPTGAVGVIGQVAFAPDANAALLRERRVIAEVCRYALEARYAELGNRAPLAGSIREYLNFIADELLQRLDQSAP